MNTRKFSVAMAAVLLGIQFGSPTLAQVSEQDLAMVQNYVASGQADELLAFLALHPELLQLSGVLGDALRMFSAEPSLASLQSVAALTGGGISVAALAATGNLGGVSIY